MVYLKALAALFKDSTATHKDKIKSLFWFAKKYGWVCSLHSAFKGLGIEKSLSQHGYVYYLFKRMYVFMHKDSRQELAETDNHSLIPSIVEHYRILNAHLSSESLQKLTQGGLSLFKTELEDSLQLEMKLLHIHQNRREGLSSIGLWMNGTPLYYMNFLLAQQSVFIAGVQGGKNTLELARAFTTKTQGIPPHKYLFIGLAALMSEWGMTEIFGIRHEKHVFQGEEKTQYKLDKFDYNAFWQDVLEAEPFDDYWFRMALPLVRKDLSEVNAKKRGKLKKRYPFMDALESGIKSSVHHV